MSTVSGSAAGGAQGSSSQSSPPAESSSRASKKRPRPVLSCIECRNKKLRCDRLLPCNQCTRIGQMTQCAYQSRETFQSQSQLVSDESESELGPNRKKIGGIQPMIPLEIQDSPLARLSVPLIGVNKKSGALEELQSRVEKLERVLSAQLESREQRISRPISRPVETFSDPCRTPYSGAGVPDTRVDDDTNDMKRSSNDYVESAKWSSANHQGILSLKGTRTRYFGPNHKLALLSRFGNAANFCQRSFLGLSDVMPELKHFQKIIAAKRKASKDITAMKNPMAYSRMVELLPPRSVCDHLVSIYFYNAEKSLRIIHLPSFLRDCQQFWENQAGPGMPFHGFVPQLCAVMAVGSCWDQSKVLRTHLAGRSVSEAAFTKMVESWLAGLDWKRRIDLSTLRTQCLLYMTHQIHLSAPMETVWANAGTAVRMAMTMGLHRDPNEFPSISIFEGEQRRRLWATVVEMDLQASLLSGCPALIREGEYNCAPPANIDDLQLYEEMTEYPRAKSLDEWTDSTLQILLTNSLPLRLQAISAVSKIWGKPDYGAFLELGSKIEEYLDDLPAHVKFDCVSPVNPGRLVGHMNLDRFIRRVLVSLYRPFALDTADDEIFREGRRACIRNALAILNQQDFWDPEIADLKIIDSKVYWDAYYAISRADVMQAALTVCLEIKALSEASSQGELARTKSIHTHVVWRNPPDLQWTKASLTRSVGNTLRCLLRRLDDPGIDLRDALALSMALQSARLAGEQDTTDSLMVAGATTVIKACRQHFYGSDSAVNGLEKQHNVNLSPLHEPTPPALLGESRDLTFTDGTVTTFDEMPFPVEVDIDMGQFDLDLDIDWDWGEAWK